MDEKRESGVGGTTLFVGLGRMGKPMAQLHAARFPTMIYDAMPDATESVSSQTAATPVYQLAKVGDRVETVILMLPSSDEVEDVLVGSNNLLRALKPGALVIDMSSSRPHSTRDLRMRALEQSIEYVDCLLYTSPSPRD